MITGLRIENSAGDAPLVANAIRICRRVLTDYAGVTVTMAVNADSDLRLALGEAGGPEGFTISDDGGTVVITGNDERGLLYGIGKFLHTCQYRADAFGLSRWRGTSVPDCSFRGIYIANNFNNWNRVCPLAEMKEYIEDLALWGLNSLAFCFPYYAGLPAVEAEAYLARNRAIIEYATGLGIRAGLLYAPNQGYGKVPKEIQAAPFPDADPPRRGGGENPEHFVCPSKAAGRRFLLERLSADLDCYAGLEIDFIASFPYDAGGCGCRECWPWGARGFINLSRDLARLGRERFPKSRFVLTTWCFDIREESDGEYEGLARVLADGNDWCDVIMTDAHGDFPSWPLKHGVPGGLPMINFAEISMWGRYPWGGSGANPFPKRLVRIWRQAAHLLDGGLPYSEGRFEDLNKVTCLSLFWNRQAEAQDIVREYAGFAFGDAAVEPVAAAVELLEDNYPRESVNTDSAQRAEVLLKGVDSALSRTARRRWRWRLLYLRSLIDREIAHQPAVVSADRNDAYEELTELYCADHAGSPVAPRARSFYDREDVDLKGPVFAEHIGEQASDPTGME